MKETLYLLLWLSSFVLAITLLIYAIVRLLWAIPDGVYRFAAAVVLIVSIPLAAWRYFMSRYADSQIDEGFKIDDDNDTQNLTQP